MPVSSEFKVPVILAKNYRILTEKMEPLLKDAAFFKVQFKGLKETAEAFSIDLQIWISKESSKGTLVDDIVVIDKTGEISSFQLALIGWAFISLAAEGNNYKEQAKDFLQKAISLKIPSCLPYYLLAENKLIDFRKLDFWDINGISLEGLRSAMAYDDIFPEYYLCIISMEENAIRRVGLLKKAVETFPHSVALVSKLTEHLIAHKHQKEALEIIERGRPYQEAEHWMDLTQLMFYQFQLLCHFKKFQQARAYLKERELSRKDDEAFLLGLSYLWQKNFTKAAEYFRLSIEEDFTNQNTTFGGYIHLLYCSVKSHQLDDIEWLLGNLEEKEHEDFTVFPYPYDFRELAEAAFRDVLKEKIAVRSKAKAKGYLAFLTFRLRVPVAAEKNGLLPEEKVALKKAETLVEDALKFFPFNSFFNHIRSKLYYFRGAYKNALLCHLWSLDHEDGRDFDSACLKLCPAEFISSYTTVIKELAEKENDIWPVSSYFTEQFPADVEILNKKKLYHATTQIFEVMRDTFDWYGVTRIWKDEKTSNNGAFEVAYAYSQLSKNKNATSIYELLVETGKESSAVLNNLALLYEKNNQLDKARTTIIKAKKMAEADDEIVSNNYKRLAKNDETRKSNRENRRQEPKVEKKLNPIFDVPNGHIIFNGKKCAIPLSSNQYMLCKSIFEKPLGEWVKEIDVINSFYRGSDSQRSFYDAVRLVNQKVEKDFNFKEFLDYKASMARVRMEIFQ